MNAADLDGANWLALAAYDRRIASGKADADDVRAEFIAALSDNAAAYAAGNPGRRRVPAGRDPVLVQAEAARRAADEAERPGAAVIRARRRVLLEATRYGMRRAARDDDDGMPAHVTRRGNDERTERRA